MKFVWLGSAADGEHSGFGVVEISKIFVAQDAIFSRGAIRWSTRAIEYCCMYSVRTAPSINNEIVFLV